MPPSRKPRSETSGGWLPFRKDKPKERYYLLPGMGGRMLRKKQLQFLRIALGFGLLVAGLVGYLIYRMNQR